MCVHERVSLSSHPLSSDLSAVVIVTDKRVCCCKNDMMTLNFCGGTAEGDATAGAAETAETVETARVQQK